MSSSLANVEDEYKKFPETNKEDVLKLMEWCKKQSHLPNLTELEVVIYLHSCCNSVETTKTCIDTAFTVRTHCPEFFARRDAFGDDMKAAMDILLFTPLPGLTPDGYKLVYCKVTDSDPSKFNFNDALKLFSMVTDLWIMQEGTAKGHVLVCDMDGVVFGHLARLGIISIKKFMYYLQEAMPVRLKGLHFVNIVSFMDKILALMRPFMKKELMDVLELHTSFDSFYKHVNKEQLPNEYGGQAGTLKALKEKSYDNLQKNRDYFVKEESERRVNEKLRPGKPKGAGDLFGVEGNFKKLDFD